MVDLPPSAAADLVWVLQRGLERGGHLLTAGELHVVRGMLSLPPPALEVWARLVQRRHPVQRRRQVGPEAVTLARAGLVDVLVPWSLRAERSTVAELKQAAQRLGLPRTGLRAELVERVKGHRHWSEERWVRVRHRALVRRLERFAWLEARPDPSKRVVERLGHVRWPDYPVGRSRQAFADRRLLLRWEAVAQALCEDAQVPPERLTTWLEQGWGRAWARLGLQRRLARAVLDAARQLERQGAPDRARALYERVVAAQPDRSGEAALRIARTLESTGRTCEALDVLAAARATRGPESLAIECAGRRLARSCRRGWAPARPAPPLRERTLQLALCGRVAGRPQFGEGAQPVELAVIEHLAACDRLALHGEGGLWRHVYGLLFGAAGYFQPVGQLPVPGLPGPLDVGTPGFARRRPAAVARVMHAVRQGQAGTLVEQTWERHGGCRLAGVRWADRAQDVALVEALGPGLLRAVLEVMLERGWGATAGMPDLVVLPGDQGRLPGALPGRLPTGLLLAEVKSPGDRLSHAQRWWLERLHPVVRAEVWRVRPVAAARSAP